MENNLKIQFFEYRLNDLISIQYLINSNFNFKFLGYLQPKIKKLNLYNI